MIRMKLQTFFLLPCILVQITIIKHQKSTSHALTIQGTIFDILNNTFYTGADSFAVARDYVDCVVRCVTIFGHDACEVTSFNTITHSCQKSVDQFNVSMSTNEVNYVTAKKAIIDCGTLTIPNGLVSSGDTTVGSVLAVSCSAGYVVTNNTVTCLSNGTWTESQCLYDCSSLNPNHATVTYSTPGSTYYGFTATMQCEEDFAFPSYDTTITAICTESGWKDLGGNDIPLCWELMFRGTMGNGYNLTDIYMYGGASTDVSGMTTSLPECKNVFNTSCTLHYRNPGIDSWGSIGVKQVRYEFYNNSQTVMSLTMRAEGSTMNNWLEYGKTESISLPWTDIASNMANTWWAVADWDTEVGRSFRIIENYGYCATDILYTFVVYEPWRDPGGPPEDIYCNYETEHTTWPQFMYTLNGVKSNFHLDEYGTATTMAIWVLHD